MLLPWRGLFEQAMLADVFIFHDNILLPRSHGKGKSFQTRVQIKTEGGWEWLSLPVDRGGSMIIKEARFVNQDWRRAHLSQIRKAYRKAPYFDHIFDDLLLGIYQYQTDFVGEFCVKGMVEVFSYLGLEVPVQYTSDLPIPKESASSRRVLDHCLYTSVNKYISGHGAMNYIDYELLEQHGVKIYYMDYSLKPYPQLHGEFNPYVSIIDLLFNVGPDCRKYLGSEARYWREMVAIEGGQKKGTSA